MTQKEITQKAAISVLPECVKTCNEVLMRGGRIEGNSISLQAAKMAVEYGEALAYELTKCK